MKDSANGVEHLFSCKASHISTMSKNSILDGQNNNNKPENWIKHQQQRNEGQSKEEGKQQAVSSEMEKDGVLLPGAGRPNTNIRIVTPQSKFIHKQALYRYTCRYKINSLFSRIHWVSTLCY